MPKDGGEKRFYEKQKDIV